MHDDDDDDDVKALMQERNTALADKKTMLERQMCEQIEKQEALAAQKAKLEAQSHQQQALISSLEEDLASSRYSAAPEMIYVIEANEISSSWSCTGSNIRHQPCGAVCCFHD